MTQRYLVCEGWGHLFTDNSKHETTTRFVYDSLANGPDNQGALIAGEARWDANGRWEPLDAGELADLNDSVVNANPDAIENPAAWDLEPADELPDWAEPAPAPKP